MPPPVKAKLQSSSTQVSTERHLRFRQPKTVPEVRATQLVEVINPKAKKYEIKKPFVVRVEKSTVEVADELRCDCGNWIRARQFFG